ncbi:MAG: FISUMP domain-containing protein [Bacteroidota bacterium]|nr:FISUMP domain-containing protein [Bacteroidota bacterium]
MKRSFTFLSIALMAVLFGCEKNSAPTCEIISPDDNQEITQGDVVTISVEAEDPDENLKEVRFYMDDENIGTASGSPYSYSWNTGGVAEGSHTIEATAIDDEGDEASDNITITIVTGGEENPAPSAAFSTLSISVGTGVAVTFTDESTNDPTSWSWDFGDGETSTEQNPSHIYLSIGTYTVELSVSNDDGSDTETKTDYIEVTEPVTGSFTDQRDGTTYETVRLGDQEWMSESLKYLPEVSAPGSGGSSSPYYYVYGYDGTDVTAAKATDNYSTYGVLYNYNAAMAGASSSDVNPSGVQGVCPNGWHLPSDAEWKELEMTMGMSQTDADDTGRRGENEGSSLAKDSNLWPYGALRGSDHIGLSGFDALPGGNRATNTTFENKVYLGNWWSATVSTSSSSMIRVIEYNFRTVYRSSYDKKMGLYVRCVKDE